LLLLAASPPFAGELIQDWRQAIRNNRLEVIRQYLKQIDHVDLGTALDKTALMAAASQGDVNLVRTLLTAGADVNAHNKAGGSALIYAAWSGDTETVAILLNHGAEINHQSGNGWTALMMVAAKDHAPVTELLAKRGADPNLPDVYGWTPLMRAAYEGHARVVGVLLERRNSYLESRNDHGQSALHLAVIQGHTVIVTNLLAHGARPDAKDFAGNTPVSISLALGNKELAALLEGKQ
jgi:ankyrin repeat protein